MHTRRNFLTSSVSALAAMALVPVRERVFRIAGPHPTPRPGITGAKVSTREQLGAKSDLVELFDAVRNDAGTIDGIRCNCGCSHNEGFYSLLTCFEGPDAMAKECKICQGQGRLATRLHRAGKTLDEIRAAVDAKYA